jgi:predicted metal-binding membrane protein
MSVSANNSEPLQSALAPSALPSGEWFARTAATGVFLTAAGLTLFGVRSMSGGMPMPGGWTMPMMWMVMPGQSVWSATWMFLVMWQAMMVAMMLPSTWPMLSLYRRVAIFRETAHPSVGAVVVGAGYFGAWLAFGAAAFGIGFGISSWAMHSEKISRLVPPAAGLALVLAGIYQLTPLKQACLKHCREPVLYLGNEWRPGMAGALRLGLHHGGLCAACCWALMVIQMILGVMNLEVMIAIAAIIGTEKLWKRGPMLARAVGVCTVAAGAALIVTSVR